MTGKGWRAVIVLGGFALLGLAGCAQTPGRSCADEASYFPAGLFPSQYPASDELRRRRYAAPLQRLGEPSLACAPAEAAESYRLLWLNNLAHPVVIRVSADGEGATLAAAQLSGWGWAEPGEPLARSLQRLTTEDWQRLRKALQRADFWHLPTSGTLYGVHGGQWVIEGQRGGHYHLVDRWSPAAGEFRELGELFFDLAGWLRPEPGQ